MANEGLTYPPQATYAPPAQPGPAVLGGVNYMALLQNYPGLAQQIQAINDMGLARAAQLTETRRRSLAQFGQIPDAAQLSSPLVGNVNADINPLTRDLAAAATQGGVSTIAQLQRQQVAANNQGIAQLAAHGLARSGGVGQTLNENLGAYQRGLYGANQALQDQLGSAYQTFLGQQQQGQQDIGAATQKALEGITGQINAGLIGGGTTTAATPATKAVASPSAGGLYPGGAPTATAKPPRPVAAPGSPLGRSLRFG